MDSIRLQQIMRTDNITYVIGHKNPDTDSVVSAAAYAALKQAQGMDNCIAVRAGKTTPQTEYIFNRFHAPLPEFLPDLIPKAAYYRNRHFRSITMDISLWEAMTALQNNESRAIPVVDKDGCYHSLLHYSFFGQKLLTTNNPKQKTTIQTSIELLASVLNAQVLVMVDGKEVKRSPIVVGAAAFENFKEFLATHIAENTVAVCGNRQDVITHAITSGVRAVIITNGHMIDRNLQETAKKNKVSVLVSPYDTSSTTLLLIYSMPAYYMSNTALKPVRESDPIKTVAPMLATAPDKSLPVVDRDNKVVGIISENDLYHEPNIRLILVDHNELSQAIEGAENYRILEIIDHHRLGAMSTKNPITFINMPVGATCTIVASQYLEQRVPMQKHIASILLCGILADTLALQSATTTAKDMHMADYLASIADLDIDQLGKDVLAAASNISGRNAVDLVNQDMKAYDEAEHTFTVSQIEVGDPGEVLSRKQEFMDTLEKERSKRNALFSALLVTDITELSSLLLLAAEPAFEQTISLPKLEDSVFIMKDVVSRKKQLMPILSEMVAYHDSGR